MLARLSHPDRQRSSRESLFFAEGAASSETISGHTEVAIEAIPAKRLAAKFVFDRDFSFARQLLPSREGR